KAYLVPLAREALPYLPASLFAVLAFSIAIGRKNYTAYNLIRGSFSVFYLLLIAAIWLLRISSVRAVVYCFTAAAYLCAILGFFLAKGPVTDRCPSPDLPASSLRLPVLMKSSLPFGLSTVAAALSIQLLPLLLTWLLTTSAIGIFTVALAAASAHAAFGNALAKVLFSEVAGGDESRDGAWVANMVRRAIAFYLLLTLAMMVCLPPLVPLVFGRAFAAAGPLSAWLVPASSAGALAVVLEEALRGTGRAAPATASRIAGAVVLAALAVPLVPRLGNSAMVVSATAGGAVQLAIVAWATSRQFGVRVTQMLLPSWADYAYIYEHTVRMVKGESWRAR
ncbi:MAG TPA: polysaccharide biosynthesis C-terminal domain-containing protein, partial [Polyangiaceae bacterium]